MAASNGSSRKLEGASTLDTAAWKLAAQASENETLKLQVRYPLELHMLGSWVGAGEKIVIIDNSKHGLLFLGINPSARFLLLSRWHI